MIFQMVFPVSLMGSRPQEDQRLAKQFDKRFKTVFWVSKKCFIPEFIKKCLPTYKDFYVKEAPEVLSELRQNILSLLCKEKVRHIHVILTGENEIEKDFYNGHRYFLNFIQEIIPSFNESIHFLIVCNFIPNANLSNLSLYQRLYEKTAIGLKIINAKQLAPNTYFFDPCKLLINKDGAILHLFEENGLYLNQKGTKSVISSLLKIILFLRYELINLDHFIDPNLLRFTKKNAFVPEERFFKDGEKLMSKDGRQFFVWE